MQIHKFEPETSYVKYFKEIPEEISWNASDFKEVWDSHPKEFGKFHIYGKEIPTPRWSAVFLHDYSFSRSNHIAEKTEMPKQVKKLLEWVQSQDKTINGVLINWYQNGHHYIGKHSDSESDLVPGSQIWSFSFGQERRFVIEAKKTSKKTEFLLPNNSLIVMCGTLQKTHTHAVPKVSGKKGESLGPRINITFRSFKEKQV